MAETEFTNDLDTEIPEPEAEATPEEDEAALDETSDDEEPEPEPEADPEPEAEPEPEADAKPRPKSKRTYKGKVDGKEITFEKSDEEVVRALQKESASDRRFEEAAQAIKGMRQFADDLLDFETRTPSGRSKALDTIVQLVAKRSTGGDVPKAIRLVEEQLLGPYVQARLEEEMLPDGERERRRAERERDEYRQRYEDSQRERESAESAQRIEQTKQIVAQHWDRKLQEKGLTPDDPDVVTAENLLGRGIEEGHPVTEESLDRLLGGILDLKKSQRTRTWQSTDPAALWDENPELAEKIVAARKQRTEAATTPPRARAEVHTEDPDATPPRRRSRAPETSSQPDDYEEFFSRLR